MDVKSPLRTIVTDFRAGEVDPRLAMRVDTKLYPSGARSLRNSLLSNTGAVSCRNGSTRLVTLAGKRRLLPFEYDSNEKYILAFGTNALEIYDADGVLVQSFSGSTDCPWNAKRFLTLTIAQRANTMIIASRGFKPRVLKRTSLSTFTIAQLSFDQAPNSAEIYQPYVKFEDASVTLQLSAVSGSGITVTASSSIFSSAWVGDTIRVYGIELTITGYTSDLVVTATAKKTVEKRLDPNPFLYTDGSDVIEVTDAFHGLVTGNSVTFAGAPTANGVDKANINGARTITVIDEDHYSFVTGTSDVADNSVDGGGTAIKVQTTAATRDWDEAVFSDRRGWPGAVCFHEDRLWFGGTSSIPDGLWSSCSGDYFNFDVRDGEDDASIQTSVGSSKMASIRHLHSNRVLQIFTEGPEFVLARTDGTGLTPGSASARSQTAYGCSTVRPHTFDGATIFLQGNDKTVREQVYEQASDGFQAPDLMPASAHLVSAAVDMTVITGTDEHTEQYAFVVNGDGTMAVFHSLRAEQLAGWTPWQSREGDFFESVLGLGTKLFVAVNRDGVQSLERIEMDDDDITLDFAVSLTAGSPSTSWALGAAYAGKTVDVISGRQYLGTFTADAGGGITLENPVSEITAGYDFEWRVIPHAPDMQLPDGPMTGEIRRIVSVTAHLYRSYTFAVDGRESIRRYPGEDFSEATPTFTGKLKRYLRGYDRDPVATFTRAAPLPVTLLGVVMEVSL